MKKTAERQSLLLLILLALLIAAYWMLRYGGWSIDGDAVRLTLYAEGIAHDNTLNSERWAYSNGYGYPALLVFLAALTGLSIPSIQFLGSAWLAVIVLAAYLTYAALLADGRQALFAAALLLVQPDFMFYILRSSHERSTWTLGLLVLWLWSRERRANRPGTTAAIIVTTYLLLWAMISNNAYFGSTIITTCLIGMLARFIVRQLPMSRQHAASAEESRNMPNSIPLTGFILVFLFVAYTYAPARSYFFTLSTIADKMMVLFLGSEANVAGTYSYVETAWVSQPIYLLLTSAQWAITLAGFAAWLRDSWVIVRRGPQALTPARQLLWYFYVGFAAQVALGVIADLSGALASNLQLRMFTPFVLVSSPMAATWLATPLVGAALRRPLARIGLTLLASCAVIASLLKMTNDPLVGNQWIFYSPDEQIAAAWVDSHLSYREVWLDLGAHQLEVMQYRKGYEWQPTNRYVSGAQSQPPSNVLISTFTLMQANRSNLVLPEVADFNQVYDNGESQFYHRPTYTQYQQ